MLCVLIILLLFCIVHGFCFVLSLSSLVTRLSWHHT